MKASFEIERIFFFCELKFIRSQKKNAQLVYNNYIYNKKLTQVNGYTTWRCADVLKLRCKAVIISNQNQLIACRRTHNHEDHRQRIGQRPLYSEEDDLAHEKDTIYKTKYIKTETRKFFIFLTKISFFLEFEDLKELLETEIAFIETPWSTPCLVLNDYMYNCHSKKNSKEYWRCHNYSKKEAKLRCRARCVLENGKLKMITGSPHNHAPHTQKINKIMHRNRVVSRNAALEGMATFARIKYHKRITVPMEVLQMPESNYNPSLPAMEEPQRVTLIEEVSSVDSENANANIKTDLLMDEPVMLLND